MPGPWEKYGGQTAAAPSADPIIKPVDQFRVRDQQLQEQAAAQSVAQFEANQARAAEDQQFQREKFAKEMEAKPDLKAGTVDEKKIATLVTRIAGGFGDIENVRSKDPSSQEPGLVESMRGGLEPGGMLGIPARKIAGANRRTVFDTQRDVLDALLTLGTGAAYNSEQLSGAMVSHFPQYGDSDQEIAIKNQRLQRIIAAAKVNAGPAWEGVEPVIAQFMQGGQPVQQGMTGNGPADDDPNSLANLQKRYGDQGLVGQASDDSPRVDGNSPGYQQVAAGLGDIVQGVGDVAGIVANPLGTMMYRAAGYDDNYDLGQILRDASGLPQGNETIGAINRAAAGGLGMASAARGVAGMVAGPARNALMEFGASPMRDMVTGGTAAASGELARASGAGPVGQAVATIAGGAAPNALRGFSRPKLPGGTPPSDFDPEVVNAGARQRVPIRRPDAAPSLRGEVATVETTQHGGPMIRAARAADAEAMGARAAEIGGGRGFASNDPTSLGQSAQRIAERGEGDVREVADKLYKRVERTAPGFSVPGSQTTGFIDQKIADLQARSPTGYQAEIAALENMKSDIAKTGLSVETLQAQRMTVGGRIGDNIADRTRADATLSEVLKVAQSELHTSLASANPAAASVLKRADAKWGQYKDLQREVTGLFLGKRGDATAETAARQLNSVVNGNSNALRRFMTLATPEEKADFATTFVQDWGATGRGEFSPALFAKKMNNTSDRTLTALLGAEGRKAVRDLQLIGNAKTAAASRQQPSGVSVSRAAGGLKTLMMASLGFTAGGPGGAAAAAVSREFLSKWGQERAARMLINPDFTKWFKNAPNTTNPQVINGYFRNLTTSAAKSPVYAGDVKAFQDALADAFRQSPAVKAAATEERPKEN